MFFGAAMEEEAVVVVRELKICLPVYKIVYSVFFIIILCLVRGITNTDEIGIALEPAMAILTAAFCADTYVQEIVSGRSEIHRLYPMNKRIFSVFRRVLIQGMFLLILSVLGYGLFLFFQRPYSVGGMDGIKCEMYLFFTYVAAVVVTICFWEMFSVVFSCLLRNMWAGIACSLVVWIVTDSSKGQMLFGKWNLFSYTFRDTENYADVSWLCGKVMCIFFVVIMLAAIPAILKKRG